jgi:hypothetical protein
MRQFDIVRLTDKQMCVVLQHDLLSDRRTRVVVPLLPKSAVLATPRLHPTVRVGRQHYILAFDLVGAVEVSDLDCVVGSARDMEYEIKRAYDMLIAGV